MLLGGDKTVEWNAWYQRMIPIADELVHLFTGLRPSSAAVLGRSNFGGFARAGYLLALMPFGNSEVNVPEGQMKIAFQRWEVCHTRTSPEGTAERCRDPAHVQPSLRDSNFSDVLPGVETPGYSRMSLRDNHRGPGHANASHSAVTLMRQHSVSIRVRSCPFVVVLNCYE